MEVKEDLLDELIKAAEKDNAVAFSVKIGEHKGWNVRVSVEKPEEEKKETKKQAK